MIYYRDPLNGEIFAYSAEQVADGYVRQGLIKMTEKEVNDYFNPPKTKEDIILEAKNEKSLRLSEIARITQTWQVQMLLGMITDEDKAKLIVWMKYQQEVSAVDPTKAPDIEWPSRPN